MNVKEEEHGGIPTKTAREDRKCDGKKRTKKCINMRESEAQTWIRLEKKC